MMYDKNKPMKLGEKQELFAEMLPFLLLYATSRGYKMRLGEILRPAAMAKIYAEQGKGIANSLHRLKLAIDIYLFKDGKYLTKSEDYEFLGEYWESIGGTWGGRFGDGNHFSLEHNGIK